MLSYASSDVRRPVERLPKPRLLVPGLLRRRRRRLDAALSSYPLREVEVGPFVRVRRFGRHPLRRVERLLLPPGLDPVRLALVLRRQGRPGTFTGRIAVVRLICDTHQGPRVQVAQRIYDSRVPTSAAGHVVLSLRVARAAVPGAPAICDRATHARLPGHRIDLGLRREHGRCLT